jgi:TRAP-type C4-dicarboxylate transport system permease small subunit
VPETARNVLIILALAALVMLAPGGGNASAAILQALVIAMLASIAWFGVRLYREHLSDIYALGDRNRGILYASAGLVALTVTATDRLWNSGPGTVVWVALVALSCYGVYYVFRASREY